MTKTAEKIKIIQDIYALPNSYLANLLGYSATYIRNIRNDFLELIEVFFAIQGGFLLWQK